MLGLCLALLGGPAHAVAARYHIPAGSLDDVLRAFAQQSGSQLLYPPELTAGKRSGGLEGTGSTPKALADLLRGSGLRASEVAPGTFVLERLPKPPAQPSLPPVPVVAQATELGMVEVTGTHLRRTAWETAGPLSVIDRNRIEHSGYQTLFELLRAQPGVRVNNAPVAMSDGTLFQNNGLSGATGAAAADLHGLGATATLFLIDGQRMAGYGLAQGEYGVVNDLDSIPLALVERIEILRDGASAIYGSDAMAGVVNIILRKRFEGLALDGNSGLSSRGDAAQQRATVTMGGHTSGGAHFMLSLDWLTRSPLLGAERRWATAPSPQLPAGADMRNAQVSYFYFDEGQVGHVGGTGCPRFQPDDPCSRYTTEPTSLQAQLDSRSMLAHADHPLGALEAFAELRWTMLRQRQQSGPATADFLVEDPTTPDGLRQLSYAFADVGPVRDLTQSRSSQITLGLRGTPGDWNWEGRLDSQRNSGSDRVSGLLRDRVLTQALDDGSYQLGSRSNARSLLAAMSPTLLRTGQASQDSFSLRAAGPLAHWKAGDLALAAGVEGYREQLDDQPDPLLIGNEVFQFQPPYVRHGDRWNSAAYFELESPLGRRVTLNVASRADHSGGYGWAFSPRLGLKWDVADAVSLRGTLARGYRAPTLPELDRPRAAVPSGVLVQVPISLLPCRDATPQDDGSALCMLRLDRVSNPDLTPERSSSATLGLVVAPSPALGIALDLYQIRRTHEINALPVAYALEHPDSYPQLFRRDADGVLYAFDQQLVNLGHTLVRTVDLDLHYRLDTEHRGVFAFNLGVDWLAELRRQIRPGEQERRYAGFAGQPRATALAGLDWSRGPWNATLNLRYTGHYRFAASAGSLPECPKLQRQAGHCTTPAFSLLDVNLDYTGLRHWRVGVNVRNLLDHRPVYYGDPALAYSPAFDDVIGRYVLLSFHYRR